MSILLDILGATLIGALLLLMIIKLNLFVINASYYSDSALILQQNAKTLGEIINSDLRKIGYNYEGVSIIIAETTRIKFYADMNEPGTVGYGTMDIVEYYLGDSTSSPITSNPRDRVLYRIINEVDTIAGSSLGLVDFELTYLNSQAAETSILEEIKYVKAELWVQPYEIITNFITGESDPTIFTYWELTINPRNI